MRLIYEEYYKSSVHAAGFTPRKTFLNDEKRLFVSGVTLSGKSYLAKNHLLQLKKSDTLYLNCADTRLDSGKELDTFCSEHSINIVVLDNYTPEFSLPDVTQLILIGSKAYCPKHFVHVTLESLDFEEFLAYEKNYDLSALNHYFQLGGFPTMRKVAQEERAVYLQNALKQVLDETEYAMLIYLSANPNQTLSAFMFYERLKKERKTSKNSIYKAYASLFEQGYMHELPKLHSPKAGKKLYLCDFSLINALSTTRNFAKVFENAIYLELIKKAYDIYYDTKVDFIMPKKAYAVLSIPFSSSENALRRIEACEAQLLENAITSVDIVTMSTNASLHHPLIDVTLVPFNEWALSLE